MCMFRTQKTILGSGSRVVLVYPTVHPNCSQTKIIILGASLISGIDCYDEYVACDDQSMCVDLSHICNSKAECPDASDEYYCSVPLH